MATHTTERRLAVGAELRAGGGVDFRCWAPHCAEAAVVLEQDGWHHVIAMDAQSDGYFSVFVPEARAGTLYRYRLGSDRLCPDPASRFQPQGPHGQSEVVDPSSYRWRDAAWRGPALRGQVLYEMHVGTFTAEGTWDAAALRLGDLAALGITTIEMMPVAEFAGAFGWGYDGVDLFAPTHLYGRPDDLRAFVDAAHGAGLAVILDVVYNHIGPDGNYLEQFSASYFTSRYANEWGAALNFDGPGSGPVREFFVANAGYWIDEFHFDGLRLDATQSILDASSVHVLAAITDRIRHAASGRRTLVVGENEPQDVRLVHPSNRGGHGLDALWNDDFHHSAMVAVTGRQEAYYTDYAGRPQEFVSMAKRGYLYQGQWYAWQKKRRGSSTRDIAPAAFVTYLQNHDQVANSGRGERLHQLTSPGRLRAMTALLLLLPATPMLFQGQEFAASSPFLYFADHAPGLAENVRAGRGEFLAQFPGLATPDMGACLANPGTRDTFDRCKLDWGEREGHASVYQLHRDLLALRRTDPVFNAQSADLDGAVIGDEAFLLRFFSHEAGDRLLIVNLGRDLELRIVPEPLLAPPSRMHWSLTWSSEAAAYGGCGTAPPEVETGWRFPGHAALVLAAVPA